MPRASIAIALLGLALVGRAARPDAAPALERNGFVATATAKKQSRSGP